MACPRRDRRILLLAGVSLPAREISPSDKFLWSCYMICWGINRDFSGFEDRPLDRPQEGVDPRLVDRWNARDAGIDALSVDIFVTDRHALPTFGKRASLVGKTEATSGGKCGQASIGYNAVTESMH